MEMSGHNRNKYDHGGGIILRTAFCILSAVLLAVSGFSGSFYGSTALEANAKGIDTDVSVFYPFGEDRGYSAVLYNNTNGLPTPEANDIVQTEEGFIFIGSYSGLSRYDGNTFEQMTSLKGITGVSCLYVDSSQRLWIGSADNGVGMLEKGNYKYWGDEEGMSSGSVYGIAEAPDGFIYVATRHGLFLIDRELELSEPDDERIRGKYVYDIACGKDGTIFCLTNDSFVFTMKDGRLQEIYDLSEWDLVETLTCIYPDPSAPEKIYLGTSYSYLMYVDLKKEILSFDYISIAPLADIEEIDDTDGMLWVCASNGAGVLEGSNFLLLDNVPMNDSFVSVMQDSYGNYWFASDRQGVMKIVQDQFQDIFKKFSISEKVVNATCIYDNKLFIGTDRGLIVLNDKGKVLSVPVDQIVIDDVYPTKADLIQFLSGVRIRSMLVDSRGRLWISTWQSYGLLCYENGVVTMYGSFTYYDESHTLPSSFFRAVCELRDGSIAAAMTGGILVIGTDGALSFYGENDGLDNAESLTVAEGLNGEILVGSNGDGIYVISDSGVRNIGKADGLLSDVVMRIKKDRERDIFWIVTKNSLAYMTSDYKVVTVTNFPYSNNFDLYQNSRDELWVLSSNGIYVVSAKEMLANNIINAVHYGITDGLPCIATANSYSELIENGDLYIAGGTGVAKVNIEEVFDNTVDLRCAVPYIDADGVRIFPDKNGEFRVSGDVKKLTVYPFVFNYSLVDPQVSYRLAGFEENSTVLSRSSLVPVDYTNLSGGEYDFELAVIDQLGDNDITLSVRIIKETNFYERPLFYILCAAELFIFIIIGYQLFIRLKINKLEKRHREEVEKERLRTELSTANQIQTDMMPSKFPPFPERSEFDIYASVDPAKEVGGDFYDFFFVDDDHLCIIMADVSGKGVPAALFMMISKVILNDCAMMKLSPAEILTQANENICANNKSGMFVTAWVGILEISTGRLTASNAGHEYPVFKSPDGIFELFKDKHGLVLGGMRGIKYRNYELTMEKGSKLFLYTDGVPEASDKDSNLFETGRMVEALNTEPEASPERILKNVRRAVDDFVKDAQQFDDLTMLCLDYYGKK